MHVREDVKMALVQDTIKLYTPAVFLFTAVVGLIFLLYKFADFVKYKVALTKVPAPKGYPIIGNLLDILVSPEQIFTTLQSFGKKFYPLYRISSGHYDAVMITSPEDAEIILSGMKHLEKNKLYEPLHEWLREGLLVSTGQKWQFRRKILTPTFHFNILQQFALTFIEQSEKLVEDLKNVANKSIDVVPIVTQFTLHTICETAMGTSIAKSGDEYRDAVYKMGELTVYRIVRPWFYSKWAYMFSLKFWESIKTANFLQKFSMKVIKERERNMLPSDVVVSDDSFTIDKKKRLAMLDLLLSAKRAGSAIDDKGIQEEVDTFMFEGHDTTAMSISFTFMLLACNPDVQDKILEEIHEILGEDTTRSFTMNDLNQMKYLERALKESLRLYPSVPMIGRYASEEIKTTSNHILPTGTLIMVRIYDIHRNPDIYPEPEKFDPDRFLPENAKGRHPYAYIPFSAGPRNCIGQKFAVLELKAAVASVVRNFLMEPIDTPETVKLQADLIIRSATGVRVLFKPRSGK